MCGIAGVVTDKDISILSVVEKMCNAMSHRGPNDFGYHNETFFGLGHRRLSILDLSKAGHQPMYTADNKCIIAYNGEVYNFKEVQADLIKRGHTFFSNTDTEVILKAYIEYGRDCVKHFRGMFAFAILDKRGNEPELFIARDHFGIKPFLWSYHDGSFVFSSELRSIISSGIVDRSLDNTSIGQLMMMGYTIKPATIYKNVRALPPGHAMIVKKGREPKIWKYWDLDLEKSQLLSVGQSYEEQKKQVRELLINSVEEQLVSDVPLGAFLSGGIDSTIIVGIISKILGKDIQTFSVGFPDVDDRLDESQIAANTAQVFGTIHKSINIKGNEIKDIFHEVPYLMDEPSLGWPQWYLVSQATKRNVTVALSGLGADEFFMGYRWLSNQQGNKFQLKKKLGKTLSYLGVNYEHIAELPLSFLRSNLVDSIMLKDSGNEVFWRHHVLNPIEAGKCLNEQIPPESILQDFLGTYLIDEKLDSSSKFSYLIAKSRMLSIDIRDIDAASMAHSLEVRVPFLDKRLVEYTYGLPESSKVGQINGTEIYRGKRILIDAFQDILPKEVYSIPKRGFNLPYDALLLELLTSEVDQLLTETNVRRFPVLNTSAVVKCWKDYKKGKTSYREIWSLLSLMLFLEKMP